jgi:hypothetical protein
VTHPQSGYGPDSSPPVQPYPAPYSYGTAPGQEAYGHSSPPRRPVLAYAVTALMLAAALVLIVGRVNPFAPDHSLGATSDSSKKVSSAQKGGAKQHKPDRRSPSPANAHRASGAHWSMQVPRSWTSFDAPGVSEQAAWRTSDGIAGYGDVVTIVHEPAAASVDLVSYTYGASAQLQAGVGSGAIHVFRTHAFASHGEIEYRTNPQGHQVRSLVYIVATSTGYASATFAAPASTYKHDLKRAKPYLKTLTGR